MSAPKRRKHIPQRTCVACRTSQPKRQMVRIVRTPEGNVVVDETGKRNGRGAYLCRQKICWDAALTQGHLERALRVALSDETLNQLQAYADTLPQQLTSISNDET